MTEESRPFTVTVSSIDADGDEIEVVEFGGGGPRDRHRLLAGLAAGLVAVAVVVLAVRSRPAPVPTPKPSASASPTRTAAPLVAGIGDRETDVAPNMLGVTESWQLVARSDRTLFRIDLASGQIGSTPVPPIATTGVTSFVTGSTWTIVQPNDAAGGYIVSDGSAAGPLPPMFSGPVLAGPDPGLVWIRDAKAKGVLFRLYTPATGEVSESIELPDDQGPDIWSDGHGGLLTYTDGVLYDSTPDGGTILPGSSLLAIGPRGWLVKECVDGTNCNMTMVDSTTARTTEVAPFPELADTVPGLNSPDGRYTALLVQNTLQVLDQITGGVRFMSVTLPPNAQSTAIAWSPDGQWIFAVDASGSIDAIDMVTGTVHKNWLPGVTGIVQVTVRPAP